MKKIRSLLKPDVFLFLIILLAAIRFSSEVPIWFDIPQSDDTDYMYGGIHFLESLHGETSELEPDWSPLYQLWFFLIYQLFPDSVEIFYVSIRLIGIFIPVFTFLLLRKAQVTRWLAVATAAYFLASYAVWIVEPRVTSFAALVLLFLWWLISFFKERWKRLWVMATSSLFIAYSRPEFFLMTVALSIIAITYLGYFLLSQKIKLGKAEVMFITISGGITILFLIWWGVPFSGARSMYAFGQHYASNVKNCLTENTPNNVPWEEILARDYGNPKGLIEAIRANPLNFRRHLTCNIQAFPKLFLKVAFSSAWGSSWSLIRIWVGFILFRLITAWREIKYRLSWLWEQDFLLFALFSGSILLIDVFIIYPREHYLNLFAIIVWVLGISLFGFSTTKKQNAWQQSIALGLCLLLLLPSLGTLFNFDIPQKPVLKTVETIRALNLDEPLRIFATPPFQTSRSKVYFDENYIQIGYKPATVSFEDYIDTHQPNVIVITKAGLAFKDDPSWITFEANSQEYGFNKIPFDQGDQWGLWEIYLKKD